MRFLASSIAVLAMTAIMPPEAPGQGAPGTNLSVDVSVPSVTLSGDTVTAEYVLFNRGSSAEELVFFTVNAPAPPISLSLPQPSQAWKASTLYRERSVARWAALKTIPPGAASPRISFRAVGVPAIVTAWYRGNRLPTLGEDDPEVQHPDPETPTPDVDPLTAYSVAVQTVGIEPLAPGATPASLTSRLETLTGQSCSLGWISQPSFCTTLRGHLTAQPVRLASFKSDLTAGHTTGSPVTDNAYWLLKVNADYILSLAPGQATPVLTWPAPAPIAFGTALSAAQLNATATGVGSGALAGNFSYTPAAGTVLQPGAAQALSVVFTPTDRTGYTTAGASVTIAVRYTTAAGHRFLQPVNTPPQNRSVFQLGSTVPVKFQLFRADGVTPVTTAVANLQVNKVSNGAPDPVNETVYSTVPDQGIRFRYAGSQYVFNLGTRTLAIGTYRLTALLDDGSTIVQDIELRGN